MSLAANAGRAIVSCSFLILVACGGEPERVKPVDTMGSGDDALADPQGVSPAVAFSGADLDAFITALRKETEILRAGQERQRTAATPQQRIDALQSTTEEVRIPEAARAAGLSVDRYRAIRATVMPVLETMDFQDRMKGPMTMDTTRVGEDVKARLRGDAMASLRPASRDALTSRLSRIEAIWGEFAALRTQGG
ncbi:MAG: hypothetical protein H0T21_01655 [Gemmatimonadaceae bacterium]|nr:hypothetical protein [Gemmatimonadaceae bacterium]